MNRSQVYREYGRIMDSKIIFPTAFNRFNSHDSAIHDFAKTLHVYVLTHKGLQKITGKKTGK
jgi:hypothetical protein